MRKARACRFFPGATASFDRLVDHCPHCAKATTPRAFVRAPRQGFSRRADKLDLSHARPQPAPPGRAVGQAAHADGARAATRKGRRRGAGRCAGLWRPRTAPAARTGRSEPRGVWLHCSKNTHVAAPFAAGRAASAGRPLSSAGPLDRTGPAIRGRGGMVDTWHLKCLGRKPVPVRLPAARTISLREP